LFAKYFFAMTAALQRRFAVAGTLLIAAQFTGRAADISGKIDRIPPTVS
jgi:hypothetical protein